MDGIVYLSFINPKTQKEAVKLVYQKDYQEIDMRPFREARKRLVNQGYLKSDGSMRNAVFTSSMQAFLDQIENNLEDEGSGLESKEKERLYKICNSEWFRHFFNSEIISEMWGLTRNESGRLDYSGAGSYSMRVIGQVFRDLWAFGYPGKRARLENNIDFSVVDQYNDFDEFIEDQGSEFILDRLELLPSGKDYSKEEVFEEIKEGHNFTTEWQEYYLKDLVFESQMLYQLPRIPVKIMNAIPGREHSYYHVLLCDFPEILISNYRLNPSSYDLVDEDFRSEFKQNFEQMLSEGKPVRPYEAVPLGVDLSDEEEEFYINTFRDEYTNIELR